MKQTNRLQTFTSPLLTLRDEANEESSPLAIATESDFDQKRSEAKKVDTDSEESNVNGVQIQMGGGSAAGKTFTWLLYGWREANGIATLICNGTATLGTMQYVKYPNDVGAFGKGDTATNKFWADTISITGNNFVKTWSVTDSGNDRAAILSGDLAGYKHLYLEAQDADGSTGTEAGNISAFFAGW